MPAVSEPHAPQPPGGGWTAGGLAALGGWLADDATIGRHILGKTGELSAAGWWQAAALARACAQLALAPADVPDRATVRNAVRAALDLAAALGHPPTPPGPDSAGDYRSRLGQAAVTLAALLADPAPPDLIGLAAATDQALRALVEPARLLRPTRPAPCTRPALRRPPKVRR